MACTGANMAHRSVLLLAMAVVVTGGFLRPKEAHADRVYGAEPGPRSAAHRSVSSCEQCHVSQRVLSEAKCLACHEQIRKRMDLGRGLHSHLASQGLFCFRCHREHRGDQDISGWTAIGGQEEFDHAITGFPLRGWHAVAAQAHRCQGCHSRAPKHFDPASNICGNSFCHQKDDVHAGELGDRCSRCHVETAPFNRPIFKHNDPAEPNRWPLIGHHLKVACDSCHPRPKTGPVPAFKSAPKECKGCHNDVHRGRYKQHACSDCHTPLGWRDGGSQ